MRRDQVLIDYLLDTLPPEQRRQVEDRRHADAAWAARLEQLRRRLRPLERERRAVLPPPGLARRTIRALHRLLPRWPSPIWLSTLPRAPRPDRDAVAVPAPRRADVVIAASILLVSAALVSCAIGKIRVQSHWAGCQNALRDVYYGWQGTLRSSARAAATAERIATDPLACDMEPAHWSRPAGDLFATAISSQIITMCNCQECGPPQIATHPAAAHRREGLPVNGEGRKRGLWDSYPDGNPFRPRFMTSAVVPPAVPLPAGTDNGYWRVVAAYGIMPSPADGAGPRHSAGWENMTAACGPEWLREGGHCLFRGGHCLFRDGHVVRNPATCLPLLP